MVPNSGPRFSLFTTSLMIALKPTLTRFAPLV